MLPVPPSSAKCAPTWSTVRRKSWLHPLSRDRVDNLSVHDLMRYEKMDETRSLILPKHLFNFQAQPFKMDSMRRQKAENKFPLILYDTSVPTGKFVSTPNKLFRNAEILGSRHKLKSQDNVQLLKPSVQCTILPWKSENLNKLLPLDKIKLLKKSNSGIGKKKHYPMNMSLLKSHFVMNKCNLPNPTIFQLLKLDKISPKIKQPFCKLIKLPYLKHSSDKHTDHNQNKRQMDNIISDSKEIPILGSKRSIYPNYHASTCKANSQEHTSQILTYPVVSEQYNEDQPTLNDISWAVDTTKDNIIKPMLPNSVNVCSSSHRDTNSPACGNEKNHSDFGAQFNFVDYGGPKAQVGFGTFRASVTLKILLNSCYKMILDISLSSFSVYNI
ncbi:unnamed protein product [Heterobilharzia americana]|nr:unnamed protein product [Heterobilharzia americana]